MPDLDLNYAQILQSRANVALLGDTDRRVAPFDGRPSLSPKIRTWSGDARAHWDSACHEHNYSLANALSAARKAERDAAATKK